MTLPSGIAGTYYLFVVADANDQVYEYNLRASSTGRTDALDHPGQAGPT